jgi:hypothetical protein
MMMVMALVAVAMGGAVEMDGGGSSVVVGTMRITGMSPTLIRVEPKGPMDFEDRTTFMVRSLQRCHDAHTTPMHGLLEGCARERGVGWGVG